MRILTQNHLMCIVKGCPESFPLKIEATKVEQDETDMSPEFIRHIVSGLKYDELLNVAKQFSITIPDTPEAAIADEESCAQLHKLLIDTHIMEGHLCCPGCERKYKINNGIPNMLLREDEL